MKSFRIAKTIALPIMVVGAVAVLPLNALADVKSLSSSELTETFIKDSTIIVTPKQQQATRQKTITSLTITPYDLTKSEIEEIEHTEDHLESTSTAIALSEQDLRDLSVKRAIRKTTNPLEVPSYDEINEPLPVAEILEDSRFEVPQGDEWARMYAGNQLGISLDGPTFTFSIGTPEGVGPISIPETVVNQGPVDIVPRIGGGFDITFTVPSRD